MTKKKKILIITSIIMVIVIVAGGIFTSITIKNANDKKAQEAAAKNVPAVKKANADTKKMDGVKASIDGDSDKAKQLLLEAQAEYKALNDTNNVVDTDAQLYFIEHPSTPPAADSVTSN